MRASSLLCVALALSATFTFSNALSWPVCNEGGQVWVTERPRTDPVFPGANLWLFCDGSLNVLGDAIAACVNTPNGEVCGQPVADAICQLFGYDRSFESDTVIVPANVTQPVVALTGDYCVRKGQYQAALPDDFVTAPPPGEPCEKIQKLTCIRTLDTMAAVASLGLQQANQLGALNPTPAAEDLAATAALAQQAANSNPEASNGLPGAVNGRKMLL